MATQFEKPGGRARRSWGFAGGAIVGVVVAVLALVLVQRSGGPNDGMPRLTREAYEKAGQNWDERGPKNYNLDIEVTGNRPGKIHVEVRDGQATHMVRDGVEPSQRRTWYYWTVPGMLDTIGQELDKIHDPATGFGAPVGSEVILWAEFDAEYGYPRSYRRVVAGQNLDMGFVVKSFEVVKAEDASAETGKAEASATESEKTDEQKSAPE